MESTEEFGWSKWPSRIEWTYGRMTYMAFPGRLAVIGVDPDTGPVWIDVEHSVSCLVSTHAPASVYEMFGIFEPEGAVTD